MASAAAVTTAILPAKRWPQRMQRWRRAINGMAWRNIMSYNSSGMAVGKASKQISMAKKTKNNDNRRSGKSYSNKQQKITRIFFLKNGDDIRGYLTVYVLS